MSTRPSYSPLAASDFTSAFPSSRKVYVDGARGVRVPMREIVLSNGETLRVYDSSGPHRHDPREGLPKLREPCIAPRRGTQQETQLHYARKGTITAEMEFIAIHAVYDPELVSSYVAHDS